jgi:hypothetical protein
MQLVEIIASGSSGQRWRRRGCRNVMMGLNKLGTEATASLHKPF